MWRNWAGDVSCRPATLERPGSTAEVAEAVERAAAAGRTVRCVGAGHSFSGVVPTDGTLLDLRRMDGILDADPASRLVRVQAGITLNALSRGLRERGLAMPNLGDIDVQHLGGALATGTHGTGATKGNLSSTVEAMQVVTGTGEVREVDGGDALRALRVSTGSLGAVTEVTLRCVPAFRLEGVDRREPIAEVLDSLEERVAAHEHFELWTFPFSKWALTRTNTPTDAPPAGPPAWRLKAGQIYLDNHLFETFLRVGRRVPAAVPHINRAAGRLTEDRRRVADSFEIFASPRLFRFTETEQAVPAEHAAEAVRTAREILERHRVGMPVELRFSAADDALLSPAHERPSAWIAVHVYIGNPIGPLRAVEQAFQRFAPRPHWGKRSWLAAEELAPRYPRWEDFQAVREELDPEGRFQNGWARRALTGTSAPRPGRSAPSR